MSKDTYPSSTTAEPKDRFDALVRDRDSLRAEVTDMRKSLEEIQSKHKTDMDALQEKLDDTESKKEQAETQYKKLLERVNTIKSQLGQRLKEDEVRADPQTHTTIRFVPTCAASWHLPIPLIPRIH